jgi:hypothetical protein
MYDAEISTRSTALHEGDRVGRFLLLRDHDGCLHAVAAGAVSIMREVDDGTLLMLPGGKMLVIGRAMRTVLDWLDGRGPVAGGS